MKVKITKDGDNDKMVILNVLDWSAMNISDLIGKKIVNIVLDNKYEETTLELE